MDMIFPEEEETKEEEVLNIYACSDLHTHYKKNFEYLEKILKNTGSSDKCIKKNSICLISGDISHSLKDIEKTFDLFIDSLKFKKIFYVIGNHELWVTDTKNSSYKNSIEKMKCIKKICEKKKIEFNPFKFDSLCNNNFKIWIVPILSWFNFNFIETVEEKRYFKISRSITDNVLCKWPWNDTYLYKDIISEKIIKMNKECNNISKDDIVITFSHFLPRKKCLPPKECLKYDQLLYCTGSLNIDKYIRKLNSICHIFGHTHINADFEIENVRYVQNALGYPTEPRPFLNKERKENIFFEPILSINLKNKEIKHYKFENENELFYMNKHKIEIASFLSTRKIKI